MPFKPRRKSHQRFHFQEQETMKSNVRVPLHVLVASFLIILSKGQPFHFFYFVQQWPGSFCDTKQPCCRPTRGNPVADFGIHGLWPANERRPFLTNCNNSNPFNASKVTHLISELQTSWPDRSCPSSDGIKFWKYEWNKHGTCSEKILDQSAYFKAALDLKKKVDLVRILNSRGIKPVNGSVYSPESIFMAIKKATGFTPTLRCNSNREKKLQLFEIRQCVDTSGKKFIDCPAAKNVSNCVGNITFPGF